ncbi:flavin-containing monooxygenase [Histoplasma capsulatum]|uniref:Flavin-containing monooxygenase n=1 Tax=Ajellomyces capsulatus TaxID=5037 RepID=A0A8A1M1D4_AJECA|nr:hypothetical protein HCAG_00529 [Histoplasma mississippiense (nom. inval.)]EDN02665.1 hypothetical protein HCAG_00529 [Histoplasma mississippiense (nom. inval.)]QSS58242.1 flavin-containing monooxygenase [Histoplasma capsulatum]
MRGISSPRIRRVAIIGAGPSGLAAAKYLLAEKWFEKIDIFEQRSRVGGVWNYSPAADKKRAPIDIPQTNAHLPIEEPIWHSSVGSQEDADSAGAKGRKEASFISPLYDGLETNIPHTLMRFSDKPFPADTQLFPGSETVLRYIEEYSEDVKHLIRFQVQVVDVRLDDAHTGTWVVTRKHLETGSKEDDVYDAVVAANGHYNVPYIPSIPGISEWNAAYANAITHSKSYSSPAEFRDKKVVVVGNSASGLDIGAQIRTTCRKPLLVSVRSASSFAVGPDDGSKIEYPQIVEFLPPTTHNRAVRFENGEIEEDVDAVLFCTGYFYSFPFLSSLKPPVVEDGNRTLHVYQQIFYADHPTLAFLCLGQKITPFPVAENQSAVIARVWSGRLNLPSKQEMYQWEDAEIAARGPGKAFHIMKHNLDAEYVNGLHAWAASAEQKPGLENEGRGRECTYWSEKHKWIRERVKLIKMAFIMKGEKRYQCRTSEEVGFDFEAWKAEQLIS